MQLKKISITIVSLFTSLALLTGCNVNGTSSHEHSYKLVSEVLPTCTSDGIKAHYECEGCDKNFDFQKQEVTLESLIIPAHHSLVHSNKEDATCLHDGHKEFWSCSACEKLFDDAEGKHEVQQSDLVITDGPHSLEHISAKEGNCTEKGNIEYWHCTLCGEYFLDADGGQKTTLEETFTTYVHVIQHVDAKEATCEEAGYLEHYECSRCGKYFSDSQGSNEVTPDSVAVPMSHNMIHYEGHEETCTEDGNIEYWQCSKCHKYYSDVNGDTEISLSDTVIPASHALTHHVATDTSCDHAGNTEYWSCSRCGKYYSDEACTVEIENNSWVIPAVPHTYEYTFNAETQKIIKGCTVCGTYEEITPTQYVETLVFHDNNNNVAQFKVGSLGQTAEGTILNPESIDTNLNINKNRLSYFGDSLTVGFYKDGAFANRARGDRLILKNTIVQVENNYYVIGRAGCVYTDTLSRFINVTGSIHNELIQTVRYQSIAYFDLKVDVDLSQWSITTMDNVGETWTLGGGAVWQFNRIRGGDESEFAKFGPGSTNGQTPECLTEVTVQTKSNGNELAQKYVRIGFNVNYLQESDMIVFKGNSLFTDDGNGKNAIVLDEEIQLLFDGQTLNQFLGDVDLSTCEGTETWGEIVFRFSCLKFDVVDHDVIKTISIVITDGQGNKYRNKNTFGQISYYDNDALHGIMGNYDVDDYTPASGDTLEIEAGTYISVGVQTHRVAVGVTFTYNGSAWVI